LLLFQATQTVLLCINDAVVGTLNTFKRFSCWKIKRLTRGKRYVRWAHSWQIVYCYNFFFVLSYCFRKDGTAMWGFRVGKKFFLFVVFWFYVGEGTAPGNKDIYRLTIDVW